MPCRSTTDNCICIYIYLHVCETTGEWHTAYLTKVSSSHPQVLGICLQWGSNKCHFNLVEHLPWREDLNILIKMQQGNKESRKYIHKYWEVPQPLCLWISRNYLKLFANFWKLFANFWKLFANLGKLFAICFPFKKHNIHNMDILELQRFPDST